MENESNERAIYSIDPLEMCRMVQLMPAFYKIFRVEGGINTYQSSILFTIYNIDTHNDGVYSRMVCMHNPMSAPMVNSNIKALEDMGYIAKDKRKIYITVSGMACVKRVITRLNSYRGETIHAVELVGTFIERKKERKQKAITKLANNPHMISKALELIEEREKEKGLIDGSSNE